jgi:hypothetical protein
MISVSPICCRECDRTWIDGRERWRLYLTADEPPSPVPYCPDCAAREFDSLDD